MSNRKYASFPEGCVKRKILSKRNCEAGPLSHDAPGQNDNFAPLRHTSDKNVRENGVARPWLSRSKDDVCNMVSDKVSSTDRSSCHIVIPRKIKDLLKPMSYNIWKLKIIEN